MVASEKKLLWHPRQLNKFIVGGSQSITLYEWDYPNIRHVSSQHDLQHMKCFAWSPDPSLDDLVAVGHTTGTVDLIRLEASKATRPNSGVLSSGPRVSLTVRNSRACNALAFSSADPNYLAVGLDKVRGDCSLVIWDIQTALPTLSVNPITSSSLPRPQPQIPRGDIGPRDSRILQQHAPADTVSALAFVQKSTHLLLAGISLRWFRLFDLRSPLPATSSVASKVHGITTDPYDPHRIGCFGDGFVTVWDARKLLQPILTFSEKDATGDGAVLRANSVYSTIEFSSTRRGTLATLERDAMYMRLWDILETQSRELSKSRDSSVSGPPAPKLSWPNLPWSASANIQAQSSPSKEPEPVAALVLSDTRRTKSFLRPLASFALVPSLNSHPLASHLMVVNKEGDLELHAIHDTPKQSAWSARGDLAIGAGKSYQILSVNVDRLYQGQQSRPSLLQSPQGQEQSLARGRERTPATALFGRGDEDGFPALISSPLTAKQIDFGPDMEKIPRRAVQRSHSQSHSHTRKTAAEPLAVQPLSKVIGHIVAEDISMKMRRRVLQGYGIGDPRQNSKIIEAETGYSDGSNQVLIELWAWINHSKNFLSNPTSKVHGYEFSYVGLMDIWEGLQPSMVAESEDTHVDLLEPPRVSQERHGNIRRSRSPADDLHGDFHAALRSLNTRRGMDRHAWKPNVATKKLLERQIALQLVGWSFKDDEFDDDIKRWEKEGSRSRAACWLVFTRQFNRAIELLLRSGDETHQMMSGTIAALSSFQGNSPDSVLQKQFEHLAVKLQDPYFRAMLTHLNMGDWSDVLAEEIFPFRERLAIAFQFLDDNTLTSYLRSCRGDIDSLIVTGLTKSGMDLLQTYVDKTGDVQTAAILGAYVNPWKVRDTRAERWLESYRDLLDGYKLHHHRVAFDVEYGQILSAAVHAGDLPAFSWVPSQILIRCNYCNKPVNNPGTVAAQQGTRPTSCPNCSRYLPRCSVCLLSLSIVQDAARELELDHSPYHDTMDDAIVICQTCRHGGHASHLLGWFFGEEGSQAHDVCAVADCDCQCANEF
ncbi:hypothetical protein C8J56DRAFT_928212 [Mycena floridula]|nr:hypothetical protein C8J56DRAFT_928212 [Mycena floridula]